MAIRPPNAELSWEQRATRLVKVQLAASGVNQEELARILTTSDRPVSAQSVRSRLARGTFSAAFLLEVLAALECATVDLEDY